MITLPFEDAVFNAYEEIVDSRLPFIADDDDIVNLSRAETTVFLVCNFDTQLMNGGFHQWMSNPTGGFACETLSALEVIGATTTAHLVRAALEMISGTRLSRDYTERQKQIDALIDHQIQILDTMSDAYSGDGGREDGTLFQKVKRFLEEDRGEGTTKGDV